MQVQGMGGSTQCVHPLGEYNGDCIVENTLSKHQHVEGGVNLEGMKDGQSGHWVHSRDERAKREADGAKNMYVQVITVIVTVGYTHTYTNNNHSIMCQYIHILFCT